MVGGDLVVGVVAPELDLDAAGRGHRDRLENILRLTEAPHDFDTIEVPFPERGGATLLRWSDRQARERAGGGATKEAADEREDVDGRSEPVAAP